MTQQTHLVPAPPPAPDPIDAIRKLIADITMDQARLKRTPPADIAGVVQEMRDTLFEYVKDIAAEMARQQEEATSIFGDIDGRLGELENEAGGGTQFAQEDAEKFLALAQGVDFIIATVTGSGATFPPEVTAEFARLKSLAGECMTILADTTLEDDDDDDDGESAEPGASRPGG
jgi:hypothetical protein